MSEAGQQRIDKWLWFARLAKSRTAAQHIVEAGRVRVNRDRISLSSRQVRVGDVLTLRLDHVVRVLRVLDTGTRRGPPGEARGLYEDLAPAADRRADSPAEAVEDASSRDRASLFPSDGED